MDKNSNLAQQITNVYFALAIHAETVVDAATAYYKTVTFFTGYDWEEIVFTPGTAKYSEKPKSAGIGKVHQGKLDLFYPGEDTDTLSNMENKEDLALLVKIVYGDGQIKLMGTKENPAKMLAGFSIGGKTGYDITITRTGERAFLMV